VDPVPGEFTGTVERQRTELARFAPQVADLLLIGICAGYSTLGRIGFEGRYDYGAVGNVVILARRLSDVASPGEIPISQRALAPIDERVVSDRCQSCS
jgi:class 3 adenylate cyclase